MSDGNFSRALRSFPTGCLCNAHPGVRAMAAGIKPLTPGMRVAGPAFTAKTIPGENAAIHRAVAMTKPGHVLVVDGGGSRCYGPFGDILASACQNRGITGLVIDSTIRDQEEIKALGFPVFSLGGHPGATKKTAPGLIDIVIECGGVTVSPGDYIAGDDDGVVVIPKDLASKVIFLAGKVMEREKANLSDIKAGKTTCDIFNIQL